MPIINLESCRRISKYPSDMVALDAAKRDYINGLKKKETIAICTDEANEQHYEVPTRFFELCLGENLKYSCGLWECGAQTLEESEIAMLEDYCIKAQVQDGMKILDLGCGWGSLSLFLAKKYPNSSITGLSNSSTQRESIMAKAQALGLTNLQILTRDMNTVQLSETFDRIISIEMFGTLR